MKLLFLEEEKQNFRYLWTTAEIYFLKIIWQISSGFLAGFGHRRPVVTKWGYADSAERTHLITIIINHPRGPSGPKPETPYHHLPIQRPIFRGQTSPLLCYFLTSPQAILSALTPGFLIVSSSSSPFHYSQSFLLLIRSDLFPHFFFVLSDEARI